MKKKDLDKNNPATHGDLELWGSNLAFQAEDFRKETEQFQKNTKEFQEETKEEFKKMNQRFDAIEEDNRGMKKSIDLNTEAMSMLTQELREIKRIEFQVYNHENRITKLEAGR